MRRIWWLTISIRLGQNGQNGGLYQLHLLKSLQTFDQGYCAIEFSQNFDVCLLLIKHQAFSSMPKK